jgi:hypothetical protein
MMHRAGMVSSEDAQRVLDHARERGVTATAAVVELGVATEAELVRFLQSKLMIPRVDAELLQHVPTEAISRLSGDLAWAHEVLPVSVDDVGNLTVAMADPTDLRGVDAVVAATSAYVIRAVTPRTALRAALARTYGPPKTRAPAAETATPLPPPPDPDDGPITPLSPSAFARMLPKLVLASDRDEITQVLIDFLAEGFARVIMFVNTQGQLRGRDARGEDMVVEAVRQVRIPTGGDSTFRQVIDSQSPFFGPWPTTTKIDQAFASAMGGIEGNVLVLPVALRGRVPVLMLAMGTQHPLDPRSLAELVASVSKALERLIFRRKSHDNLPPVR